MHNRRPSDAEKDDNVLKAKLHVLEIVDFIMDMRVDFRISQLLSLYKDVSLELSKLQSPAESPAVRRYSDVQVSHNAKTYDNLPPLKE